MGASRRAAWGVALCALLAVPLAARVGVDNRIGLWVDPASEGAERYAIRAFTPWPGTWFSYDGQRIKVLAATAVDGQGEPGTVLDDGLTVACGTRALRIDRLQREGKAPADAAAFLRGYALPRGAVLS